MSKQFQIIFEAEYLAPFAEYRVQQFLKSKRLIG